MRRFMWFFILRDLWHKYNCFSVTNARRINTFLIYSMIPSAILCYLIMYWILPAKAVDEQWYTLFVERAAREVAFSFIAYSYFKDSRDAGMATAVMVFCGINFMSELFGFHHKMFWFNAMAYLFFGAMSLFIIRDIWQRCKKDEDKDTNDRKVL